MLNCRKIVTDADELLAGKLGWRRHMTVKMHLLMCRYCRRYVRQLRWLLRAISFMHPPASDREVSAVLSKIDDNGGEQTENP